MREPDGNRVQGWAMLHPPFGVQQEAESPPCASQTLPTAGQGIFLRRKQAQLGEKPKGPEVSNCGSRNRIDFPKEERPKAAGIHPNGLAQAAAPCCNPPCPRKLIMAAQAPCRALGTSPALEPGWAALAHQMHEAASCPSPPTAPGRAFGIPPTPACPSSLWPGIARKAFLLLRRAHGGLCALLTPRHKPQR